MTVLTVRNTSKDIQRSKVETAVLPIGSVEQHGAHLPLGTDWMIAQELAKRVVEKIGDCYLLPALPYSCSQEHLEFHGTVSLKPSTLAQVIKDIVLSLYLHNIKKIIIISGHGGNWIIKPTIRELNLTYPDLKIIHSGPMGDKPLDIHAGESETSCILHLDEKAVKKEEAVDNVPNLTQEYLDYVGMKPLSRYGSWGRPSRATKEKGKRELERRANMIAAYAKQTLRNLEDLEKRSPRRSIIPRKTGQIELDE